MKKILSILFITIFIMVFPLYAFAAEKEEAYIIMYTKQSYKLTPYEKLFSDHREFLNPDNYGIDGISDISILGAYRDDNPHREPPYYILLISLSDKSLVSASFCAAKICLMGISHRAFAVTEEELTSFKNDFVPEMSISEAHFALYTQGDIMCYNSVTAASARTVLRISVGLEKKENYPYLLGDMNGDGKLSASDARTILRISVGLE